MNQLGVAMKNSSWQSWLCTVLMGLAMCLSPSVWAQDEASQGSALSEQETARLRAILTAPIDPNALKATQIEAYKQKDTAAWKLGDLGKREANLREWVAIEPIARWTLRAFLSQTEKRAEAYELGHLLISEYKWPGDAVRLRCDVARDYMNDSNLKKASELIDEAQAVIKNEFGSVNRRGASAYWLARAEMEFNQTKSYYLIRTGKWQEAIEAAKVSIAKSKVAMGYEGLVEERQKTFGRIWYVHAMSALATHQIAAGMYSDAEQTVREAYKFAKTNGFSETHLTDLFNRVADLRNAMGQFKEALPHAAKSESLVLGQGFQKGSPAWLLSQTRKNISLAGMGQWADALANFQLIDQEKARVQSKSNLGHQSHIRGLVYLKTGKNAEALRIYRNTLQWHTANFGADHYFTAFVRGMFASALWRNGDVPAARKNFEQAMRNITAPDVLSGDVVEDALRRQSKKFIFQSYLEMLAETAAQDPQDAATIFQLADYLNASSVQQALSDAAVRSGVNVPGLSDIIRKEQDAKNEMTSLIQYMTSQGTEEDKKRNPQVVEQMRLRLREIETVRKEYKAQIQKGFPEYFQLIQPKAPTHADIAQWLKPDELFVSVLPMENQTYVWAIDAAGTVKFHRWDLGEKASHELVDRIRKTLDVAAQGAQAPAFNYADAHQLYKGLLGPLESALTGKNHLILASSGALAKMPLAVLIRQPATSAQARDAAWLIKDMAVSQVPTANGWLSLKRFGKVPSSAQPLMAWGDPVFDAKASQVVASASGTSMVRSVLPTRAATSASLDQSTEDSFLRYSKIPALPETRDEVLELAKILGADPKRDLILGSDATRASVLKSSASGQLGKKQVVVFATHGLLAGDLPNLNQPALAMAATTDPSESPLLTLEDVLGLKLNADWVVLSACNTAGADGRAEEAMSGLARGFFFAGSRSLLVTHWSVESESAMQLTTHTFAAYKRNPSVRRAEALRQAMLQTMKSPQFAHPAFWAPYALVGEGGR
jgi:CHAT domain-containing protein